MTYLENKFKDAGKFCYGRAFVETLDGKTYCVNKKGKVIFECDNKEQYGSLPEFNKFKQAIIKNKQGDFAKAKIIDINGNDVIPYQINKLIYLEHFYYKICDAKTNVIEKIILPNGKELKGYKGNVFNCNNQTQVEVFENNLLFYDNSGNLIRKYNFEKFYIEHGASDKTYYTIQQNGKWGIVDYYGNLIIPCIYDESICFVSERNEYFRIVKNEKVGVADKNNNIILECEFDDVMYLKNCFLVWEDDKCTLKSLTGKTKKFPYERCEHLIDFTNKENYNSKYIVVIKNDKRGLCNLKGEIILPFIFDCIYSLDKGNLVKVKIDDKIGYYDLNGNEIIPCEYKDLMFGVYDGLIAAEEYTPNDYGKMGYINLKNETVIPFIYEFYSQPFENGVAIVNVNCEYVKYIKANGEDLWFDENKNTISQITSIFVGKILEPSSKAK